MSSIRQLAGASTFGTPGLDMKDWGDSETNKGNRRRARTTDGDSFAMHRIASISGSFGDSPHFNIAGDIVSLQSPERTINNSVSGSGFSTSFRRKKLRSSLNKNPYAIGASSLSDADSLSSPEKMSPRRSPQRGESQRSRASTWDTAFTSLKFSPLAVRKQKSSSFDEDDEPPVSPPFTVDASHDELIDIDTDMEKRDYFKMPSRYEMEDDSSSSSHSEDEEEPIVAQPTSNDVTTPKVSNMKSLQQSSENLNQISNTTPAIAKQHSSIESSLKTLSTFGADEEEEAKVEEGEVSIIETKKDRKQVSFAADGHDLLYHQIGYHADVSFMDESISMAERRKYYPTQTQEDQRKSSLCMDKLINPCKCLSWSLVGSCIIRTAPCFWCTKKVGVSATDRQIVIRLNVLIVFFCLAQIASGLFLLSTHIMGYKQSAQYEFETRLFDEADTDKPLVSQDLWSLTTFVYFLAGINVILLVAAMLAQRAIRYVNLARSVRYMWALFWILPLQIFFSIGLFDYNQVMEVWTRHWWDDDTMSWYRELFCDEGTAHGKCLVPILGGVNYVDEKAWCMAFFNATDCQDIRDDAQYDFVITNYVYFAANGIWALILAVLMWVTLNLLQAIITLPIVQRSKESNIPLWLTFPIIGSYVIGYVLLFSETSIDEVLEDIKWMGITYMVSGGSFTLLALVGLVLKCYTVLNTRQKKVKQGMIVLFIVVIILTIFAVAVVFATSLIYSLSIVDLPLTQYREIACALDQGGSCTGCNSPFPELVCPEWTKDDVARVLQTITKQSATIAAIFLVYALATLRYGFVLFRHVSRYQIEYV